MPISWTAEANAMLFLAVLEQLKDHKLKLDYNKLAEYMGEGCTVRSVTNQIWKLRKQVQQEPNNAGTSSPSIPATPPKRAAGRLSTKVATPTKKLKDAEDDDDIDESEDDKLVIKEELEEIKDEVEDSE